VPTCGKSLNTIIGTAGSTYSTKFEIAPHAYGPGALLRAWARPTPTPNKPLAGHLVASPAPSSHIYSTLSSINSMSFTLTRILFIYEM